MNICPKITSVFILTFIVFVVQDDKFVRSATVTSCNPCRRGPPYWCEDAANARECGIMSDICDLYNKFRCRTEKTHCNLQPTTQPPLIGANPCTWTPSYLCSSPEHARQCGMTEEGCAKYGGLQKDMTPAPLGSDPCTYGPSYWCKNVKNAQECGLKEADCKPYGGIKEKETPAPPGSDPCTWGPTYWCYTVENAARCGFTEVDCAKYGGITNATTVSAP